MSELATGGGRHRRPFEGARLRFARIDRERAESAAVIRTVAGLFVTGARGR